MARAGTGIAQVAVGSREELADWLEANGSSSGSIWLVTLKKAAAARLGQPFIGYDAIVEEALRFGWIDSLPRALDEDRTMLLLSPRNKGSAWSKVNRERIEKLTAAGLMRPEGLAVVRRAQADGSWDKLLAVDGLETPPDLAAALQAEPLAAHFFGRFPPSSRRAILEWIAQAKRLETRAARIALMVERAAQNRKANFPAGRDKGPADT